MCRLPWKAFGFTLLTLAASIACESSSRPWVVLVWSPNETELPENTAYPLEGEYRPPQEWVTLNTPDGKVVRLEAWRVEVYPSEEEARVRLADPPKRLRTVALGARLWAHPQSAAEIVEVLGKDKEVRALGPVQTTATLRWILVLSSRGKKGWIPQYMLAPLVEEHQGPTLADFLNRSPWRPYEFKLMLERGRISLSRLKEDLGLFVSPEDGLVRVVTYVDGQRRVENFRIDAIAEHPDPTGRFRIESSLELSLLWNFEDEATFLVFRGYTVDEYRFFSFLAEERDILAEAQSREMGRRNAILQQLLDIGTVWKSDAYGVLKINREGRYHWDGPDRLVSGLATVFHPVLTPEDEDYPDIPQEYRPWFVPQRHGGYELGDRADRYVWEGNLGFDLYGPAPRGTRPLGDPPAGILITLEGTQARPLAFSIGLEVRGTTVTGLVLVPLPPFLADEEGDEFHSLPPSPILLRFVPVLEP